MKIMIRLLLVVIGLLLVTIVSSNDDEIVNLPGTESFKINFKHYSGFLQVSQTHFLHYWFVESQNDPIADPLLFWFNGGPGCSSLDGLLNEMGPYNCNADGKTLRSNPYAWNKFASVVYIEAPAGVGYSYSTDGNTTTNDDQTSAENYEAIKQFLNRYPNYRNQSVFIMGESYAGVYVPTLAVRVIDGMKDYPVNLKGVALGNGYVNAQLNIDTSVRYAFAHGIVDEKIWNTLETECCHGCADTCDFTKVQGHCAKMIEDIFQFLWFGGLNPYDMFANCDPNPDRNSGRFATMLRGIASSALNNYTMLAERANDLWSAANSDAPCLNDSDVITYMNNAEVRRALHIPINITSKWDICSNDVTVTYQKQYEDMAPFVKKIIAAHVRVLLYYGDTDLACNFMLGQAFANQLNLRRNLGKQPWKYAKQIAGFKTLYKGLTFITVKGAGHMAPQWRPASVFYAIQQFILNHPI